MSGQVVQLTQAFQRLIIEDCKTNQERFDTLKDIDKMMIAIRLSAKRLSELRNFSTHSDKVLWQAFGSTMDFDKNDSANNDFVNSTMKGDDKILQLTKYDSSIVVKDEKKQKIGEITLGNWDAEPQALITGSLIASFPSSRWKKSLAYLCSASLNQASSSQYLEEASQKMAQNFFPDPMLEKFNSKNIANQLLKKCGIIVAEGITARPLAPQDAAYDQYANLGCKGSDEMLFWSDSMVANGYHPEFGTTLNMTALKGYKKIDMDDIISRGYSGVIDKWNRLQPPEKRVANPFRGYAAKTVPGLVLMAQQGRLATGKPLTDEQLQEAIKLTKKLHLLPSQTMSPSAKKTAWMKYSCRGDSDDFLNVISCASPPYTSGSAGAVTVKLLPVDSEDYNAVMAFARERAPEISKLKKENRLSKFYAQRIVDSLKVLETELTTVKIIEMAPLGYIPQPGLILQEIFSCMEYYRGLLSDLEHQNNDLCQKEWEIAMRVLEIKETYITKLQEQAPMRAATFLTMQQYK